MTARNDDWKRRLKQLIDANNGRHTDRNKPVGFRTRELRAMALFRIFTRLRAMGFRMAPDSLGEHYIRWLVRYSCANPAVGQQLASNGIRIALPGYPYSPAYIQQQLSVLRMFARWVGKDGKVREAAHYAPNPALAQRTYTARADRGWEPILDEALREAVLSEVVEQQGHSRAAIAAAYLGKPTRRH